MRKQGQTAQSGRRETAALGVQAKPGSAGSTYTFLVMPSGSRTANDMKLIKASAPVYGTFPTISNQSAHEYQLSREYRLKAEPIRLVSAQPIQLPTTRSELLRSDLFIAPPNSLAAAPRDTHPGLQTFALAAANTD